MHDVVQIIEHCDKGASHHVSRTTLRARGVEKGVRDVVVKCVAGEMDDEEERAGDEREENGCR